MSTSEMTISALMLAMIAAAASARASTVDLAAPAPTTNGVAAQAQLVMGTNLSHHRGELK
ncbi:MAG TPA: hypothetical protein VFB36_15175 [Nevskiaceae bacterium]|nr:hypothetical protein [Nevskiaceae bacterium]